MSIHSWDDKHKRTCRGAGGGSPPPSFWKTMPVGQIFKIICEYSGKNETETVQNYKTSYQESYV